jgi:hypothetical protein
LSEPTTRGVAYQATSTQFLVQASDIARYLISDGCEIIIERLSPDKTDAIRLFLLGPVFAALLHQRGYLPLHGSALETAKGAVIFAGPSGRGKSTLAAAFMLRGYRILADDISTLRTDSDGRILLQPAFPQLKLWADSVNKIGADPASLHRVRPELEKYGLRFQAEFALTPQPLHAVYILNVVNHGEFQLKALSGLEKMDALTRNTFGHKYVRGIGRQSQHFSQTATAAKNLRVCRVIRPAKPFNLEPLIELLESDWA